MSTFSSLAIEKLKREMIEVKGSKEDIVKKPVFEVLEKFCKQESEFAQAIYQSDKTISDCLKVCLKGVGNGISDIETYKRAVQFYFRTADVRFKLEIDLTGKLETKEESKKSILSLDFDDLFGL